MVMYCGQSSNGTHREEDMNKSQRKWTHAKLNGGAGLPAGREASPEADKPSC